MRPSSIQRSISRREPKPARANSFWMRSPPSAGSVLAVIVCGLLGRSFRLIAGFLDLLASVAGERGLRGAVGLLGLVGFTAVLLR